MVCCAVALQKMHSVCITVTRIWSWWARDCICRFPAPVTDPAASVEVLSKSQC